jgi:putative drug exporter of the RND superfamily
MAAQLTTDPATTSPLRGLERIGVAAARHPVRVIVAWLVAVLGLLIGQHVAGGVYVDNLSLPSQAQTGAGLLAAHDHAASGYSGLVVLHAAHGTIPADQSAVGAAVSQLEALPHVVAAADPLAPGSPALSGDQQTAYITVQFSQNPKVFGSGYLSQIEGATAGLRQAGLEVEYGGGLDQLTRPKAADGRSELVGFAVALVVLLIGFGSVLAAILPLLTALICVGVAVSLLGLVAAVISFGTAAPTLALMIGLGVGIDYALFLTTRYRQQIADGGDPVTAAGRTVASSGHAVLVAASTVSVALLGLYASGVTFLGQLGLAAAFGVVTAAAGAVSLVPAGLAVAGRRIDALHVRTPVAEQGRDHDGWRRYAATVARRPWWFLAGGVVTLAVLAIPLFSMRLGHVGDGADPASYTDKRAYDLIQDAFGPGANGPLTVVIDVQRATVPASQLSSELDGRLTATADVAHVSALQPTSDGALLVGTVVPDDGPQTASTTTLFRQLTGDTLPQALRGTGAAGYVTGQTAGAIQFSDTMAARLPIIIAVVVLTAFLLIMSAFRSLVLAVKAALLNLLSIGAAYGVLVAVFQWGWGRSLIGVSQNVPIESYVPMMMFAIVFGLSMDYEIFLLARVREAFLATGDTAGSVASGLAETGRVITCAALIMASVFIAFVASTDVVIKMLAIGLACSVLIDAVIVRLLLVPAVMNLLGDRCWWLPRWLDRIVPHIDAA